MREYNFLSEERTAVDRPDRRDPDVGGPYGLPPEPNPNHPKHDYEGAHRVFKQVKAGARDGPDLSTYEWGLLAYWYPWVIPAAGGESA
jgi:hypothetical protein